MPYLRGKGWKGLGSALRINADAVWKCALELDQQASLQQCAVARRRLERRNDDNVMLNIWLATALR